MKCVVTWIPLRIRMCLRNTQPHLYHLGPLETAPGPGLLPTFLWWQTHERVVDPKVKALLCDSLKDFGRKICRKKLYVEFHIFTQI